jgi:hypothetical protein
VEVADILRADNEGLEYLVAPKPINSRGDTLNSEWCVTSTITSTPGRPGISSVLGDPVVDAGIDLAATLLTVEITSPMEDVLRVK